MGAGGDRRVAWGEGVRAGRGGEEPCMRLRSVGATASRGTPAVSLPTVCRKSPRSPISERVREAGARNGNMRFGGASCAQRCALFGLPALAFRVQRHTVEGPPFPPELSRSMGLARHGERTSEAPRRRRERRGPLRMRVWNGRYVHGEAIGAAEPADAVLKSSEEHLAS